MKHIKNLWNNIKPFFNLGNDLNLVKVGFEPTVGCVANYVEGSTVVYNGVMYTVKDNKWTL